MFGNPIVQQYDNVTVVREDLIPGGTKARYIDFLFDEVDEVVYASPTQGGAQTALALAAKRLDKQVTLFVAKSNNWHPRLALSERLGAKIIEVPMGFLSTIQSRAKAYTYGRSFLRGQRTRYLDFGLYSDIAIHEIAMAAKTIPRPQQLWCAAGSGTLARGLAKAWPDVPRFVVQIGHRLTNAEAGGGRITVFPRKYSYQEKRQPPFPSDPTYERKAYFTMIERIADNNATFWNTAASATEEIERLAQP